MYLVIGAYAPVINPFSIGRRLTLLIVKRETSCNIINVKVWLTDRQQKDYLVFILLTEI